LRLNTADSLTASGVLRVQVIWPASGPAAHVHPALGVVSEVKVLPVGICVTKVGFAAVVTPLFVTVCVNVNALPCTTTAGTVFVIERSTCVAVMTVVVVLATLFDGVGSSKFDEIVAVAWMIVPPIVAGATVTAIVYAAELPVANVAFGAQVTTPAASAQVQPGMVMELNVVPGGTGILSEPPSVDGDRAEAEVRDGAGVRDRAARDDRIRRIGDRDFEIRGSRGVHDQAGRAGVEVGVVVVARAGEVVDQRASGCEPATGVAPRICTVKYVLTLPPVLPPG
jgi:hypothetical protein